MSDRWHWLEGGRRPGYVRPAFLLLLAALTSSCAYYNTFYLARKHYDRATGGLPYPVEKVDPGAVSNYNKSIDYSKKLIANYPKDKWVDDAYLLWARALLGRDDPGQTVSMLRDFDTRYPKSPLKDEALFYLGVGARKARKYGDALTALDAFLQRAPGHDLEPYAHLERAYVLISLQRTDEAARAVTQVIEHFPNSKLGDRALTVRAEALLADGENDRARADYRALGTRARTDEERFGYLLKEADCLEVVRRYSDEIALLQDASSHEREPPVADTSVMSATFTNTAQSATDRYARLLMRIGTVHMLEGRRDDAIGAYRHVISYFPRSSIAAEAQYRVAYVHEIVEDDFDTARAEYGKVRAHSAGSPFTAQATQRLANLERLAQFRSSGVDSAAKQVEAGFMLAELYLFQLEKPERAIVEYRKVALEYPKTPYAAKAMNAEAWVVRNKLKRPAEADSILWAVVRNYPATEGQLHARDYLESAGQVVPSDLIQMPQQLLAQADTVPAMTPLPAQSGIRTSPDFRTPLATTVDSSLMRLGLRGPSHDARLGGVGRPTVLARPHISPLDDPPRVSPLSEPALRAGADTTSRRAPLAAPLPAPPDTGRGRIE